MPLVKAVAVAVLLVATAGMARAAPDRFTHATDRFQIALGDDWIKVDGEHKWTNATTGQTAIVTRTNVRNDGAWRKRKSFFDAVETGVRDGANGYRAIRMRRGKAGRVPTMDLWFSYEAPDGQDVVVAMRFLFFRAYALSLAIDTPKAKFKQQRRTLKRTAKSFRPYFPKR